MTVICGICLEKIKEPVSLRCGHVFDKQCIELYFEVTQLCPNCKCQSSKEQLHRIYLNSTSSIPSQKTEKTLLDLKSHQQIVNTMVNQIAELNNTIEATKEAFQPTLREVEQLKANNYICSKNYEAVARTNQSLAMMNETLRNKNGELKIRDEALTAENEIYKLRNSKLKSANDSLTKENQKLKEDTDLSKIANTQLMKDICGHVRKNEKLEDDIKKLAHENSSLRISIETLKEEVNHTNMCTNCLCQLLPHVRFGRRMAPPPPLPLPLPPPPQPTFDRAYSRERIESLFMEPRNNVTNTTE
ncbi:uncharacterized protein BX663DRAFT_488183 [Cokeromyces recurvatus]|uniref:uncharacterized protein n=1 Tax=Cokeromyces recurvatus TaxID=90255 RepID=UPI00221EB6F5|nr:uncharacterized protein BX663DRAFT_488183 [Cokeromyces recurvatus]KAI7900553.1 hypothetical protein BX663DRAFT_488183 [Cokeromyces recurvatus]